MTDDFSEQFLRANANKDFICAEFTEVLRDLIRAVGVRSDPSVPVWRASKKMNFVLDLLVRSEEKVSFNEMFFKAVENLRRYDADNDVDEAIHSAAQAGISMLMEASCLDSAARGRISQRERMFLTKIEWIEEARNERRERNLRA